MGSYPSVAEKSRHSANDPKPVMNEKV